MIWEFTIFLIFLANFPFQVIHMQLEFEIKEIVTVLSFLFWGEAEDVLWRTDITLQLGVSFLFI